MCPNIFDFGRLRKDEVFNSNGNIVDLRKIKTEGYKVCADIGIGTSRDILFLAEENTYIILIELPEKATLLEEHLDFAQKSLIPHICARISSNNKYPFSNGLFDRIEAHYIITVSGADVEAILNELLRILDSNGLLIISGEFGSRKKSIRRAKEILLGKFIELGYKVDSVETPMSDLGRLHATIRENITYIVSKNQKLVEMEKERLGRKNNIETEKIRLILARMLEQIGSDNIDRKAAGDLLKELMKRD